MSGGAAFESLLLMTNDRGALDGNLSVLHKTAGLSDRAGGQILNIGVLSDVSSYR